MIKSFFTLNFLTSYMFNYLFGLIFFAAILLGCEDEPYQIGLELLPEQDDIDVQQVDTLTIEAYTIGPVGIPVSDSLNIAFGNYIDPVFGQTKAGLMLEFSPAGNWVKINEGAIVDTVIMHIYYDTIYGTQSYTPQIEVFSLTEGMDKSVRYYSDFDKTGKYDPENLSVSFTEKIDTVKRLTLLLDPALGYDLLEIEALNDSALFTSYKIDSIFDEHFKGLYLNPATAVDDKALVNFRSVLFTVKFHTDLDTAFISFAFLPEDLRYLTVDGKKVSMGDKLIKIFEHDYSASRMEYLNDSTFQDTVLYLQSLGGTQAVLKFPALEQLRELIETGKASVNNAELIIPALGDSSEFIEYFYPSQLGIRILNDNNPYVPDDVMFQASQYVSPVSYMNGRFNSAIWGYRFNLTAYFHEYLKGNINSGRLVVFAGRLDATVRRSNFNPINYQSVLLAGSSNTNRKITLKVTYTQL